MKLKFQLEYTISRGRWLLSYNIGECPRNNFISSKYVFPHFYFLPAGFLNQNELLLRKY